MLRNGFSGLLMFVKNIHSSMYSTLRYTSTIQYYLKTTLAIGSLNA